MSDKAWGGRFEEELDAIAARFSASVDVDGRLWPQDIDGSIAHVRMLADRDVLSKADAELIESGLQEIRASIEAGEFDWDAAKEDVHMNIEAALTEAVGEAGGRLHTGRSRNDQVATDMRLWTRQACETIVDDIDVLLEVLADKADAHLDFLMPGYTHLQRAQPVRLAHHLLAWAEMLERDRGRVVDAARRMNESPLGAAALAGTTFPIDRESTAASLGFDRPMRNSLDAVSSRDFLLEAVSALAICSVHLSRIAEELVLWSSQEFAFMQMSDAFTTGSSIMPQKKNPDVPELIRGKTGRIFGHLMALLTLMKGQPLAYNKDNQEDKEPLFDTVDNLRGSLKVFADMIGALTCNRERMRAAALQGFATATDLADYLVRKGIPFRDAHEIVGKAVALGVRGGRDLAELTLDELRRFSPAIGEDVFAVLTLEGSVAARDHIGGTAPKQVREAIARARAAHAAGE